jgi:hypothetical protein
VSGTYWKASPFGGLVGEDVRDYCRKCHTPVFRDSKNAVETRNNKVDGSRRVNHRRCPERPELRKVRA